MPTPADTAAALSHAKVAAILSSLPKDALLIAAIALADDLADTKSDLTKVQSDLANADLSLSALSKVIADLTKDFEEKYYSRDLEARRLEKRNEWLKQRLAEAEAALGVPAEDEWDSWADAANKSA